MNNPKHKLVPCPFCGHDSATIGVRDIRLGHGESDAVYFVTCDGCQTSVERIIPYGMSDQTAAETWNQRASPTYNSTPVTEPHMYSDDYTPTQPQSSLYELADKWREDRKQYCDVGTRQVYECLADELQAALAAESELRGWRDIETAPRDGTEILVLIDGIPYKAAYGQRGFKVFMHRNFADGETHTRRFHPDGSEYWERTKEADPPRYEPSALFYVKGFDWEPTDWMPLPAPPTEDKD